MADQSLSIVFSLLDAAGIVKHVDTAHAHKKDDHLALNIAILC